MTYNSRVDQVLHNLENIAKKQGLPSIGPVKGKILAGIVNKYKPKMILEIGTLHGYSAILMANMLPDDGKLLTMEKDVNLFDIAIKNVGDAGLSHIIEVINIDGLNGIPRLQDHKFDLMFLDAIKSDYLKYLNLAEENNLLSDRAVIVADNVLLYENEMQDYLKYVRASGRYRSQSSQTTLEFTKNVKDALEVSVRND
ncbi:MAG TPA: class I SAM-dependent methyltransferase [Nitrososphaeraceae archaeon]|nr:class I SAM-dependent methyltransferase [Nitrososphaeraceae archaeon]